MDDRIKERMAMLKDLDQQIANVEALAKTPNDAEMRKQIELLWAELRKWQGDVKEELRTLLIAEHEQLENEPGPQLRGRERFNTHTRVRKELLFSWDKRAEAEQLLRILSTERERFAALKLSGGDLDKLKEAVALGKSDFRDLLYAAGFANHHEQHQRWWPGQPM